MPHALAAARQRSTFRVHVRANISPLHDSRPCTTRPAHPACHETVLTTFNLALCCETVLMHCPVETDCGHAGRCDPQSIALNAMDMLFCAEEA